MAGGLNAYGFASGDPVNYSDPFGLCKQPQGRGVGICLEAFIRGNFFGVGDNRGPSANGGTFKTSIRFSIDPKTGAMSGLSKQIGYTHGHHGAGTLSVSEASDGKGGWALNLRGSAVNGTHVGPKIDFDVNVHVSGDGSVSTAGGSHDGFPSYELWSYSNGQDPKLVYSFDQGSKWNALRLFGCCDTKMPK